jgi:hypothetical protein
MSEKRWSTELGEREGKRTKLRNRLWNLQLEATRMDRMTQGRRRREECMRKHLENVCMKQWQWRRD